MENKPFRIALLGFGTVGTGTYRMLQDNRDLIAKKVGSPIEVVGIGIHDSSKPRNAPKDLFSPDLNRLVDNPDVDVVLELIGGLDPAGALIHKALSNGKHVITANKELIAKQGADLIRLASERKLDLHFEAAVGGGIPLIQPLRHQLSGNDVQEMRGILNGTTNLILTKMTQDKASFATVLQEAQAAGFAEADPTSDVDGFDAQYKLAILTSIAYGQAVHPDQIYREGIRGVTSEDIAYADILGYVIKLVASVNAIPETGILPRVHPTFVPKHHPLASVNGVYNALWLKGNFVGDVMFEGRGAGAEATASAVIGDLIDVCRNIRLGGAGNANTWEGKASVVDIERLESAFYVRLAVQDKPLVLGQIALAFGKKDVSLAAMEMKVTDRLRKHGEIAFLTHKCKEGDFRSAIEELKESSAVIQIHNWIRVQD